MISNILNFIKLNYWTILKVIFGLFILYYLIFFLTPNVKMVVQQREKIDSLNQIVKSLHDDNKKLENEILNFNSQIIKIDGSIKKIKEQKTLIKEIYHEKIINVDRMSIPELDSFFTNRYK